MFILQRKFLVYEYNQCPNIPFYLFIWYGVTTLKWLYLNVKQLIKDMKFGNVLSSIGKIFKNIFCVHKTVSVFYKINYRDKYETYCQFISGD